jgi:hypothetical protein
MCLFPDYTDFVAHFLPPPSSPSSDIETLYAWRALGGNEEKTGSIEVNKIRKVINEFGLTVEIEVRRILNEFKVLSFILFCPCLYRMMFVFMYIGVISYIRC